MKYRLKKFLQFDVGSRSFWFLISLGIVLAFLLPMIPNLNNNQGIRILILYSLITVPVLIVLHFLLGSLVRLRIFHGSTPYASRGGMSITEAIHILLLGSMLFTYIIFSGREPDDYIIYIPIGLYLLHAIILVSIPVESTFSFRKNFILFFLLLGSLLVFLILHNLANGSRILGISRYGDIAGLMLAAYFAMFLIVVIPTAIFSNPSTGMGTIPIALIYLACIIALDGAYLIPPLIFFLPVAAFYFPFHRRLLELWRPQPLPPIGRFNTGPARGLSRQAKSGITLIELLIVVAIVAIAVPMLVHISSTIMRTQARADDRRAALALAQDQIALLRAGEGQFVIGENSIAPALAEDNPLSAEARYVVESTATPGLFTVRLFVPFDPGEQAQGVDLVTQVYRPQARGEGA